MLWFLTASWGRDFLGVFSPLVYPAFPRLTLLGPYRRIGWGLASLGRAESNDVAPVRIAKMVLRSLITGQLALQLLSPPSPD